MPLWPLPPVLALIAIGTIFVVGILDPAQWLSLGIAFGIVAAGFAYYACICGHGPERTVLLDAASTMTTRCHGERKVTLAVHT